MSFENPGKRSLWKEAPKAAVLAAMMTGHAAEAADRPQSTESINIHSVAEAIKARETFNEEFFWRTILFPDLVQIRIDELTEALSGHTQESFDQSQLKKDLVASGFSIEQLKQDVSDYVENWEETRLALGVNLPTMVTRPASAERIEGSNLDMGSAASMIKKAGMELPGKVEAIAESLPELENLYDNLMDQPKV